MPDRHTSMERVRAEHRAFEAMRAALAYEDVPSGDEIANEGINMSAWLDERDRLLAEARAALAVVDGEEKQMDAFDGFVRGAAKRAQEDQDRFLPDSSDAQLRRMVRPAGGEDG